MPRAGRPPFVSLAPAGLRASAGRVPVSSLWVLVRAFPGGFAAVGGFYNAVLHTSIMRHVYATN